MRQGPNARRAELVQGEYREPEPPWISRGQAGGGGRHGQPKRKLRITMRLPASSLAFSTSQGMSPVLGLCLSPSSTGAMNGQRDLTMQGKEH